MWLEKGIYGFFIVIFVGFNLWKMIWVFLSSSILVLKRICFEFKYAKREMKENRIN